MVGLLKFLMQVMTNKCDVNVTLSDGRVLKGSWHSSFNDKPALLGRCVDLPPLRTLPPCNHCVKKLGVHTMMSCVPSPAVLHL